MDTGHCVLASIQRRVVDESNNVFPDCSRPMVGAESLQLLRLGNGGEHVPP